MASNHKQKEDYMSKDISKQDEREAGSEVTAGLIRIDEGEVHAHVDKLVRNIMVEEFRTEIGCALRWCSLE